MDLGENVPLAICTTSTVTVTTKPVSAATAPTIADRTVLAVDGEYDQFDGTVTCESIAMRTAAPSSPMIAPRAGTTQRLSRRYSRTRKRVAQVIRLPAAEVGEFCSGDRSSLHSRTMFRSAKARAHHVVLVPSSRPPESSSGWVSKGKAWLLW
jgi:hypothetical protein